MRIEPPVSMTATHWVPTTKLRLAMSSCPGASSGKGLPGCTKTPAAISCNSNASGLAVSGGASKIAAKEAPATHQRARAADTCCLFAAGLRYSCVAGALAAAGTQAPGAPGGGEELLRRYVGRFEHQGSPERPGARDPQLWILADRDSGVGLQHGCAGGQHANMGDEVRGN